MKISLLTICLLHLLSQQVKSQQPYNSAAPNGYTKKASVSEQVGLTTVTVSYHRPAVNGREGKIWGQLVHKGFADQGFGNGKPSPWRAGANETTTIEFDQDVKIEGKLLPKGEYGLFIAYDSIESILVISKKHEGWGSFFYEEKEDVLRAKLTPRNLDQSVEHLKYEFISQTPSSAVVALSWEKKMIPFKIEVDHLKQQFNAFIAESQNPKGFTAQGLNIAARWALQNNYELATALEWATLATSPKFPGDPKSFPALYTRAAILDKMGKYTEAEAAFKLALPLAPNPQAEQAVEKMLEKLKGKL